MGNFVGELFVQQGHMGAALAGIDPALAHKPAMRVEGACASGGLAFQAAVDALRAGADVALAAGVEVQTTVSARTGGDYLARAADYARQRPIDDFTFPALFARRVRACFEAYGWTDEDLAHVAVKAYANANRNPKAHMRARRLTLEQAATAGDHNPRFLSNPELQPYMKVTDCSQVSDGAAAVLLVSERGLEEHGIDPSRAVEVLHLEQVTASLFEDGDPTRLETTALAAERAWSATGLTPDDVDVAEVHDCFTIAELLMMEALGFAPRGEAPALVKAGETAIDGRIPINTGGGLIGFGHPVGATGIKQVVEIRRQMMGACGDYQVPGQLEIGLTANMGGDDRTVVVGLFRKMA